MLIRHYYEDKQDGLRHSGEKPVPYRDTGPESIFSERALDSGFRRNDSKGAGTPVAQVCNLRSCYLRLCYLRLCSLRLCSLRFCKAN